MGTANTVATSAAILKTIYGDKDPAYTAQVASRLLSEITVDKTYGGDDSAAPITVRYSSGAGVSADFGTAQATAKAVSYARFATPGRRLYGVRYIDGELSERAHSNKVALVRTVESTIKQGREEYNSVWAQQMWSQGGGAVAQVPSVALTNTYLTFATSYLASLFQVGREYQFASDDGTAVSPAGLRASGASLTCTAVDVEGKKVTFSAVINTITGVTAADYIHLKGNYALAMDGLLAWLPLVNTNLGTAFRGVTRSVAPNALAGFRYTASGGRKIDTIRDGLAAARAASCRPTRLYINPITMAQIVGEVQAFETAPLGGADPTLGHTGMVFRGTGGSVLLVEEDWAPPGYAIGIDPSDWRVWCTPSGMGFIQDADGIKQMLRVHNADAFEIRFAGYGPGVCPKDGSAALTNGLLITL